MIAETFANRILTNLVADIQLHIGPPGANGTENVSVLERREVTFTAPEHGQVFNADAVLWLGVTRQEHHTHFTAWRDGLLFIGTATGEMVFPGDNLIVDVGQLTAFFNNVAAPTSP